MDGKQQAKIKDALARYYTPLLSRLERWKSNQARAKARKAHAQLDAPTRHWLQAYGAMDEPDVIPFMEAYRQACAEEKQSDPATWTAEQRAAYNAGDWKEFSRLRGYAEAEIANFERFVSLAYALDARYGEGLSVGLTQEPPEVSNSQ